MQDGRALADSVPRASWKYARYPSVVASDKKYSISRRRKVHGGGGREKEREREDALEEGRSAAILATASTKMSLSWPELRRRRLGSNLLAFDKRDG